MSRTRTLTYVFLGVFVPLAAGYLINRSFSATETTLSALTADTHFHGITVDRQDPDRIYLATHNGLFIVHLDGTAQRVSETEDDFMGFTPHPAVPGTLYASGHPARGGNLGFIVSTDGGRTWSKLADGIDGPVDFHQMDISKADPEVVYGVFGDLQKSTDGGRSWTRVGPAPEGIIDLTASSLSASRIYAATRGGLLDSADGGRSWRRAYDVQQPATMVHVTPAGHVYAFIAGIGLIRAEEPELEWESLGDGFDGSLLLHLAASPDAANPTLYAVTVDPETQSQALYVSRDNGQSWARLDAKQ